jgi:hypothetical protein
VGNERDFEEERTVERAADGELGRGKHFGVVILLENPHWSQVLEFGWCKPAPDPTGGCPLRNRRRLRHAGEDVLALPVPVQFVDANDEAMPDAPVELCPVVRRRYEVGPLSPKLYGASLSTQIRR